MPVPNTDSVIVGFSAGKDSLATLDICMKRFKRVEAFFMYYVDGLSFTDGPIKWAEKKYGITIHRTPHWELSRLLRSGAMGHKAQDNLPSLKVTDVEDLMRQKFGIDWVATGETKAESIERRAMLGAMGESDVRTGVFDPKRRRYYPISDWKKADVFTYLKRNRIPLPSSYAHMGRSFGYMRGPEMKVMHDHFPADYRKICAVFPHVEAIRLRHEGEING